MKPPTLADAMIKKSFRPQSRIFDAKNVLGTTIMNARKFVLDESMSAFMADLAYASLLTCSDTGKAHKLLDGMRQLARLPHAVTWIEYDFRAKATRAVKEYGANILLGPEEIPEKCGWLCWRHPTLETAFMALQCSSHTYDDDGKREEAPQAGAMAYTWRSEDGAPPWPAITIKDKPHPEGHLTGIMSYRSDSVRIVRAPHITEEFFNGYIGHTKYPPLKELSSDMRYLWALLATINDLPTQIVDVRASKGFVARGRYRKFVDHKVIHLTVPTKAYRRIATRAMVATRRKAHQVRSHWRRDWVHPAAAFCDHDWVAEGNRVKCSRCHGQRIWINEHTRGDAGLGITTHDYSVEHPVE
jgi:hypothetical protein